jgi:hypothetical protein
MILGEKGWDGMNSIALVRDRVQWRALVTAVINLQVPYNVMKFEV